MAKAKEEKPSVRGYFKKLYDEHPDWLDETSTERVFAQWREDHPGEDLTDNIRSNHANLKSRLRAGLGKRRRRKRRRAAARSAAPAAAAPRARVNTGALERL